MFGACTVSRRSIIYTINLRSLVRHDSSKARQESSAAIDKLLRKPSWSVKSMLSGSTDSPTSVKPVTAAQLEHLLKLSALPVPLDTHVRDGMMKDIDDQLHFVNEVRRIDTKGIKPLLNLTEDQEDDVLDYEQAMKEGAEMDARTLEAHFDYPTLASRRRNRYYNVSGGLVNDKDNAEGREPKDE